MKYSLLLCLFSLNLQAHVIRHFEATPLEIIKIGHPTLNMVADKVSPEEIGTVKFQLFLDDMISTMKTAGGVGLAAPQVNVSKRVYVIKPSFLKKAEVIINPQIDYIESAGTKMSSEGCLSIPGKNYRVKRYKQLNISYLDRNAQYQTEHAKGFRAIVMQHEYDHLNGILISDFFYKEILDYENIKIQTIPLL